MLKTYILWVVLLARAYVCSEVYKPSTMGCTGRCLESVWGVGELVRPCWFRYVLYQHYMTYVAVPYQMYITSTYLVVVCGISIVFCARVKNVGFVVFRVWCYTTLVVFCGHFFVLGIYSVLWYFVNVAVMRVWLCFYWLFLLSWFLISLASLPMHLLVFLPPV